MTQWRESQNGGAKKRNKTKRSSPLATSKNFAQRVVARGAIDPKGAKAQKETCCRSTRGPGGYWQINSASRVLT